MTVPWRASASCAGPKNNPTPGRFHAPDPERPGFALCSTSLHRAVYEGGGALDKCRRCVAMVGRADRAAIEREVQEWAEV